MRGIFSFYKKPSVVFLTLALGVLLSSLYAYFLDTLPGSDPNGLACMEGGNLTPFNLIYGAILSFLVSVFVVVSLFSYKRKRKGSLLSGSAFSLSAMLAFLSAFCTLCVFPSLAFLGLGVSLSFLTSYGGVLKILSILFILAALYLMDRRLRIACDC